jgi:hypothetical protein
MQENVGNRDRLLRFAVGGSLLLAGLSGLRRGRWVPALLLTSGTAVLESAITRVCPVNALLGIDTREEPMMRAASEDDVLRGSARTRARPVAQS